MPRIVEPTDLAIAHAALWRQHRLRVRKTVECADDQTVVLTGKGGFRGRERQFGTETWTLRDGLVIRHQMYAEMGSPSQSTYSARASATQARPSA